MAYSLSLSWDSLHIIPATYWQISMDFCLLEFGNGMDFFLFPFTFLFMNLCQIIPLFEFPLPVLAESEIYSHSVTCPFKFLCEQRNSTVIYCTVSKNLYQYTILRFHSSATQSSTKKTSTLFGSPSSLFKFSEYVCDCVLAKFGVI